jgi:hypothetical protein
MYVRKVLESNEENFDSFFVDYVDMGWSGGELDLEESFMNSFDLFSDTVRDAINFSDGKIKTIVLAKGDITIKYSLSKRVKTREALVKMVTDILFPDMSKELELFIKLRL